MTQNKLLSKSASFPDQSLVENFDYEFLLPSEALSGSFVLPSTDENQYSITPASAANAFTAYGIVIGGIGLLLPVNTVSMIVEGTVPFCELPNAPIGLKGMANINGNILPVFDLAVLLGIKEIDLSESKMVTIGHGDDALAVTVASLPVRVRISATQQLIGNPPLPDTLQPFAKRFYKTDRLWIDWDAHGFFSILEAPC